MELRFGVNPLRSQPKSSEQNSKVPPTSQSSKAPTRSKSKRDKDARLEVAAKGALKTKEVQKTINNIPDKKNSEKEIEKLSKKFPIRLPVIHSNVISESSLLSSSSSSQQMDSSSALKTEISRETQERTPTRRASLHIEESTPRNTDIPSESEDNNPKEGVLAPTKNATARKWLSRYQENLLIEAPQKQEEAIKWRSKYQKPAKVEPSKTLQSQLSELRPKISALTRSLNSLQVIITMLIRDK